MATAQAAATQDDIDELRAVTREFLATKAPVERTLELIEERAPFDLDVWGQACDQLALPALAIPERFGGQGFGIVELGTVLEETGRVLYGGPLLATTLAAAMLIEAGDGDACTRYLPELAAAERIGSVAIIDGTEAREQGWCTVVATPNGPGWTLTGTKSWILNGDEVDVVVLGADSGEGTGLFIVELTNPGVVVERVVTLDQTRPLTRLTLDRVEATRIATGAEADRVIRRVADLGSIMMALEAAGAARSCLDFTAQHAAERVQFGRAIGSYQAVRHRCSDMLVAAQGAVVAARTAARLVAAGDADAGPAIAIAKSYCCEALLENAEAAIQLHGGIGYTWEHPAHLYLKRAKASELMFGDPAAHRVRAATSLLAAPEPDLSATNGAGSGLPEADVALEIAAPLERLLDHYDPRAGADPAFRGLQFDLGLAWVHHPPGRGGLGLDEAQQSHVDTVLKAAGVPEDRWRAGIGLMFGVPSLMEFGTESQQDRWLRPMFTGEEIWCQLFSEPGAGSDIAGLATRAVRNDDGDWVVNGQKVWTSLGHQARWGIMCARTDPTVPKHKGLTYFVVDMGAQGVEPRPLRQITGEAEFDEVYLTDVVVPDRNRIGDEGAGWIVTLATLVSERLAFTSDLPSRGCGPIAPVLELWDRHGHAAPHLQDQALRLVVEAEVMRLLTREAIDAGATSQAAGLLKLATTEHEQRVASFAVTLQGLAGLTYQSYEMRVAETIAQNREHPGEQFLYSKSLTIAGGTSEIQRTVIADRVLGLPREPQSDKAIAWEDIPRN